MKCWNCNERESVIAEEDLQYCCNGHMCGCYGNPIDPPFCEECYEKVLVMRPVDGWGEQP